MEMRIHYDNKHQGYYNHLVLIEVGKRKNRLFRQSPLDLKS